MNALLALLPASLPFFATTHEPDITNIEQLADSLYTYEEFDAAVLEYKRLLYFSPPARAWPPPGGPERFEIIYKHIVN